MPLGKRGRKWLLVLALMGAGTVLFWSTLPLWFPWVLRPVAQRFGAHYSRYERHGYARFSIEGMTYADRSAMVEVEHVEALVPTVWLWRIAVTKGKSPEPFVIASGWRFQDKPNAKPATPTLSKVRQASKTIQVLQRWIPRAELITGAIQSGKTVVTLPSVHWSSASIDGVVELQPLKPGQQLAVRVTPAQPFAVRIDSDSFHLESAIRIATNSSGLEVQGTSIWWSNRIELQAHFGRSGAQPETARLRAENFRLPAELGQLPGYGDLSGTLVAEWHRGQFSLDVTAGAHSVATQTNLPPLTLALHAYGDTNSATIQTATLTSAWLEAVLSQELTIYAHGQWLRSAANLKLTADLAQLPWVRLKGKLVGEADFVPTTEKLPPGRFHFSGRRIGYGTIEAEHLRLGGRFEWPRLEVSQAEAEFADGSSASVVGEIQHTNQTIAIGRLTFRGPLIRRWLPPGYDYQQLALSAEFHGPFKALVHDGHLAATNVTSPFLQPVRLQASWSGRQANVEQAEITTFSGDSSLRLRGAFTNADVHSELQLQTLTLKTNQQPLLELAQPCRIALTRSQNWQISTTPFQWLGPGGQVRAQASLDWPNQGMAQVSLKELSSSLLMGFSKHPLPKSGSVI